MTIDFVKIFREPVQDSSGWRGIEKRHSCPRNFAKHFIVKLRRRFQSKMYNQIRFHQDAYEEGQ